MDWQENLTADQREWIAERSAALRRQHAEREAARKKEEAKAMAMLETALTAKWKAMEERMKAKAKAYEEEFQRRGVAFQDRLAKTRMKQILSLVGLHIEMAIRRQNVKPTVDEHAPAKKIELSSSQSNGEDFPLDEPTSKEEIPLSINDEEPEVETGEILDNNLISQTDGIRQEKELGDRTEQSILEDEIGSNIDDGEPQIHMKGVQEASFLMRDIYVDTGQLHGGHGVTRLLSLIHHHDQGHDQLKFCPITGHYQEAAPVFSLKKK
ncbi:hypothetical protein ACLB2K_008119 [Fragaria x ananassa]